MNEEGFIYELEDPVENAPFVQTYRCLIRDARLTDGALRTYQALKMYCMDSLSTFVGIETLALELTSSQSTVKRNLRKLRELGFIKDKSRPNGKTTIRTLTSIRTLYLQEEILRKLGRPDTDVRSRPDDPNIPTGIKNDPSGRAKNDPSSGVKNDPLSKSKELEAEEVKADSEAEDRPYQGGMHPGEKKASGDWSGKRMGGFAAGRKSTRVDSDEGRRPKRVSAEGSNTMVIQRAPRVAAQMPTEKTTRIRKDWQTLWQKWREELAEHFKDLRMPAGNPIGKVIGQLKKLLEEYSLGDCFKLIEMSVRDWNAVYEKWPKYAQSHPTIHVMFGLRNDLMPLAQTGEGVTTRSNRVSDFSESQGKTPSIGWGDDA